MRWTSMWTWFRGGLAMLTLSIPLVFNHPVQRKGSQLKCLSLHSQTKVWICRPQTSMFLAVLLNVYIFISSSYANAAQAITQLSTLEKQFWTYRSLLKIDGLCCLRFMLRFFIFYVTMESNKTEPSWRWLNRFNDGSRRVLQYVNQIFESV